MKLKEQFDMVRRSGYNSVKLHVLKEILSLSAKEGYAYCSVAHLAKSCGMKERALQYHLQGLRDDHVLLIDYGGGRKHVNHYRIDFEALYKMVQSFAPLHEQKGATSDQKGCKILLEKVQDFSPEGCNFLLEKVQDPAPKDRDRQIRTDLRTGGGQELTPPPTTVTCDQAKTGELTMAKHSSILKIWSSWNEEMKSKPYNAVSSIPPELLNGVVRGNNRIYEGISNWIDDHSNWEELWDRVVDEIRHNKYFDGTKTKPTLSIFINGKPATRTSPAWRPTIDRVLEGEFSWGRSTAAVNTNTYQKTAADWQKPSGVPGDEEI